VSQPPARHATGGAPRGAGRGGSTRGHHRSPTERRGGTTRKAGAEATRPAGESTLSSQALARRQRKGRRTLTASSRAGSGIPAKEKPVQPVAESSAATASAASVAPAATTGVAPPVTAPTLAKVAPKVGTNGRRNAHRVRGRATTTTQSAAPVAVAASPLLVPTTAAGKGSSDPQRAVVNKTHTPSGQPAIVKTLTKIVGVVPTPVRILIAALVALALAMALRSRLATRRTRKLERQRGQLLEDVGLLQAALLPVPPARLGPVATSVAYRPADGPGAGGDFYDVFALEDGQLAVIVGDVSGHGREALPHTALLRFTVRAYLEAGLSPRKALQTAGTVLERQLGDSFVTVLAATYHPRERTLTYASAGHPPPVVLGAPDTLGGARPIQPVIASSAPPIGAGIRTGTRQTVVSVPGPAQLCFHTDGVTEARVGTDLFGEERLAAALAALGHDASAASLLDSVAEQTDARPDDMAACLLRVEDGVGTPEILREELELDRDAAASPRTERFLLACGVRRAELPGVVRAVREHAERHGTVLLEMRFRGGKPLVSLRHDNVIHTAALAAASAS
jgi:serine phosphatase RsbU (regulator of sigma subunit)